MVISRIQNQPVAIAMTVKKAAAIGTMHRMSISSMQPPLVVSQRYQTLYAFATGTERHYDGKSGENDTLPHYNKFSNTG